MSNDGPLSDILVIDLTRALAGPHAAMMLGDLGARVIKVESPTGDDTRSWGPPFVGPEDARESTYFLSANRNKESLTLDLKSPEDQDVLAQLVKRADVLMENFRVGVLDRLGFPVSRLHELNPGLVVLSITGFGHDGPEASRSGYDQIAQGEGGLMSITGTELPTKVGVPIADLLAGMNGAYGVVAALHERTRTGRRPRRTHVAAGRGGRRARVPGHPLDGRRARCRAWPVTTTRRSRRTACSPPAPPRSRSRAGRRGCGVPSRRSSGSTRPSRASRRTRERVAHRDELVEVIEGTFADEPAEHWLARLATAGVPAGKVRTLDDVYDWEQTRSQGLLIDVDHPTLGTVQLPGSPIRFDDNPHSGGRSEHVAPPTLGQHNDEIRAWLRS